MTQPSRTDRWIAATAFGASALIYLPTTVWLYRTTVAHEQLLHAFIVLGVAAAVLFAERRGRLSLVWEFGRLSQNLLIASYAALAGTWFTQSPLLMIPAYCLALAATAIYAFGPRVARGVGAVLGAFGLFILLALLLPAFDWPLRGFAGQASGWIFHQLGQDSTLQLSGGADPQLTLIVAGQPFRVAPECNGFGMFTSSLLLALLLVIWRRIPWLRKALILGAAGFVGLGLNLGRILVIVSLAPLVGAENYHLMHEIIGTIAYYGGLVLIWVLASPSPRAPETRAP